MITRNWTNYMTVSISICTIILLVLGSLTNVVGYQSVKSTVNDSPLFSMRTQRANEQQQNNITSQYLGNGINTIQFPLRDNRTALIQKIIERIRTMDDDTFNRFVGNVVWLLSQQDETKDVDVKDIIRGLNQIRENPETFQSDIGTSNGDITWKNTLTLCWFPGCLIFGIFGYISDIIFLIIMVISELLNPTILSYTCPIHICRP
jgi:hypothetical protein